MAANATFPGNSAPLLLFAPYSLTMRPCSTFAPTSQWRSGSIEQWKTYAALGVIGSGKPEKMALRDSRATMALHVGVASSRLVKPSANTLYS